MRADPEEEEYSNRLKSLKEPEAEKSRVLFGFFSSSCFFSLLGITYYSAPLI